MEGLETAADFGRVCVIKTSNFEIRYQFKESLDLNEIYTGYRVERANYAGENCIQKFQFKGLETAAVSDKFRLIFENLSNEWARTYLPF